jgi:hypothetical protein
MEGLTGECLDSLQTAADDTDFADRNKQQKQKETKAAKASRNQVGSECNFLPFVIFC